VRGKVEAFDKARWILRLGEGESRARAERYFGWPCSMPLRIGAKGCGPHGSGWFRQEHVGERVGTGIRLGYFSSDQARKELAGLPLYTRGGPAVRRRLYSKATTRKTYAALLRMPEPSQGGAQSDPRRHLQPRHYRDQLSQQLDKAGVAYCFVEAEASEKTSRKRLEARERKAHEVSDARLEDFEMLNRSYEPPLELDLQHHRIT